MGPLNLSPRQNTMVTALLVLGVIALLLTDVGLIAAAFFGFGDLILTFFLAWLLAFILSPIVTALERPAVPATGRRHDPRLCGARHRDRPAARRPRRRARGLDRVVRRERPGAPRGAAADPRRLAGAAERTRAPGRPRGPGERGPAAAAQYAAQLVGPLQQLAVASLGAIGTVLLVLILSLYMVVDRDDIQAFLFRLVPPSRREEARLLETSVSRSFGGFLRGQAILGVVYAAVAVVTSWILGIPYWA